MNKIEWINETNYSVSGYISGRLRFTVVRGGTGIFLLYKGSWGFDTKPEVAYASLDSCKTYAEHLAMKMDEVNE